ncbi:Elongation factor 1-delta [Capsicum annuum]|nr:Elongation factor 1-delta [Capsicum annuum]
MDVKPWDDETDRKKLKEAVCSIEVECLLWGASKLVSVGYGIKKKQIMLTIIDELISVDTLIEERLTVEPINENVQSYAIIAFQQNLSLKSVNDHLSGKTYVSGDQLTKDDIKVYWEILEKPSSDIYPNATAPSKEAAKPSDDNDDDDDDIDHFGEKAKKEKKAAEAREVAKASTKKKVSGKPSVFMDVKPWDDETDMKKP